VQATGEELERFFSAVMPHLNEVQRRVVAGAMAESLGRGGKTAVAKASGLSRNTVIKAQGEVEAGIEPSARLRAPGAGDKPAVDKQPGLGEALDELVHPDTRGNPMSALRWTLKSTYELARDLQARGFRVSAELVRRLLHQMGYSLQAPSKQIEGSSHPDRDGQFRHINDLVTERLGAGEPVVSVDTKKKELIGIYANGGREWQPTGEPDRTNVHDFADRSLGEFAKAIPYGVYDVGNDEGWVSVGDSADTAEFAVESIRRWWNTMGKARFPNATSLLVTADAGGAVDPTATGSGPGSSTWPSWRPRPASRSRSATTRRAPRSGTASSTACSASSRSTGEVAPSPTSAPSSSSSAPRRPPAASPSRPSTTRTGTRRAKRSATPTSPPSR